MFILTYNLNYSFALKVTCYSADEIIAATEVSSNKNKISSLAFIESDNLYIFPTVIFQRLFSVV